MYVSFTTSVHIAIGFECKDAVVAVEVDGVGSGDGADEKFRLEFLQTTEDNKGGTCNLCSKVQGIEVDAREHVKPDW